MNVKPDDTVQHRHDHPDVAVELDGQEVAGHQRHHRARRRAERRHVGQGAPAVDPFQDQSNQGAEPGRRDNGLEHVGIGDASGQIPADADGRCVDAERDDKQTHSSSARRRPAIDDRHQQERDRGQVNDPGGREFVRSVVPVFERAPCQRGIQRRLDGFESAGQGPDRLVDSFGVALPPAAPQIGPALRERGLSFRGQTGDRFERARADPRVDVVLGHLRVRGCPRLLPDVPPVQAVPAGWRDDPPDAGQRAGLGQISRRTDGLHVLAGTHHVAFHVGQHTADHGVIQKHDRDVPVLDDPVKFRFGEDAGAPLERNAVADPGHDLLSA